MTDPLVNLNEESEMNYEEMLEIAKKIHPAARLRISGNGVGEWEIYIPTSVVVDWTLPERFNGTPAAEAAKKNNAFDLSALEMFSKDRGYERFPVDCAADYYNLEAEILKIYTKAVADNNGSAAGVLDDLGPQFAGMRALLDMRWFES